MTYIPEKAHWYVAEIVEEITVDGAVDKVIHRNLILIAADSPNQAFERAIELGKQGESSYKNPEGRDVSARFIGLGDLSVVYDELEMVPNSCTASTLSDQKRTSRVLYVREANLLFFVMRMGPQPVWTTVIAMPLVFSNAR
jgi:hypothetical protein